MSRLSILIVFICLLLNHHYITCVHYAANDDMELSPYQPRSLILRNFWFNRLDDSNDIDQKEPYDNLWKRFTSELFSTRQRRRFGNTRYGRSVPST